MIRHGFSYHTPRSVNEAAILVGSLGQDAAILGGGTVLVQHMSLGHLQPKAIIDLQHLGLRGVQRDERGIVIGACTSYTDLERSALLRSELPLVATMADEITGGRQIRNQGTIGGSSCYAKPGSDVPACLAALRAHFRLVSTSGEREIPASNFFQGAFRTAVSADEFLSEIMIPALPQGTRFGYYKLKLCASSWPIVTASCLLFAGNSGAPEMVRICLGGASPVPLCIEREWRQDDSEPQITEVAEAAAAAIFDEWQDELAGPGYRRAIAAPVATRAIRAALMRVPE
jgi:carbon-monoxide dehydrogenase medium subunit